MFEGLLLTSRRSPLARVDIEDATTVSGICPGGDNDFGIEG